MKPSRLFIRFAVPLLLMGGGVACLLLLFVWVLQQQHVKHELLGKAQIIAAALETSASTHGSAPELMAYVQTLGGRSSGLKELALIDANSRKVVAASNPDWVMRLFDKVPVLAPALRQQRWEGFVEDQQVVALPVEVNNESIAREFGARLHAVMILDSSMDNSTQQAQFSLFLLATGLSGVVLMFGFFYLLKNRVLNPLRDIHSALQDKRDLPVQSMPDDEIRQLAQMLRDSLQQVSQTNESLSVMHRAIQRSSNEVFITDPFTHEILSVNQTALDNLGYSEEELLSMRVPEVAPENDNPETIAALTAQIQSTGEISYQYEHIRADGTRYPFEFKAMLVDGKRPVLVVLGNDISARNEQQNALMRSEERMKLALEGSNDGLFEFDIAQSQIFISDLVQQWLGQNGDVLAFSTFLQTIHEGDRDRVYRSFQAALDEWCEVNVEFRVHLPGERQRWIQLRGQVQIVDDQAVRLSGFASDITRQKIAEQLLQGSVTRLGAVLDHIADGILTLSEEGLICTVNPAVVGMFGLSKSALAGSAFHERVYLDGVSAKGAGLWLKVADGQLREGQAKRGDGEMFATEIAVTKMDLTSDERYTVVVRDISERKRQERELRNAIEEAQAATRAKGEFLATMSHEIRTPMNGVLGMTQLLLDMDLAVEQRETAQVILSSGESLLSLINDILDYSKIEAGKIELETLAFDMRLAVKEVMELLAASARRKTLDLYVDYADDLPFAFAGDLGRIRQVLLNLVGNAIKFTQEGHVVVRVEQLANDASECQLRVAVQDTGLGVAKDVQARLFESFTQADASTTRRFGGTGLGLAISKQLVELMGGEIGLQSEPGEGAEFWFTLTLPHSGDVDGRDPVDIGQLADHRLLAVDDNPVGLEIVQRMAESFGMQVVTTDQPQLALQIMDEAYRDKRPFDVLALDYNMPGMDGLTLATEVRADERFESVKVVLLTSSDLKAPSGLDGYAMKPVMRFGFARLLVRALCGEQAPHPAEKVERVINPERDQVRILLAEDNPVNQRVAVKMLEKLGCRVDVAANGREAVEMWEQFPYSMIFMDCQMPELDGLSATEEIRQREATLDRHRTPIVAMTANAMAKDKDDCLAAGMDDYASKPIKLGSLDELVGRWSANQIDLHAG